MEDTITIQVKLRNGNEGVWVTPVSYMSCDFWEEPEDRNKIRLYDTPEFFPNISYELKQSAHDNLSHFPNLLRLYFCELIKTSTKQLLRNSKYFFGSAVFDSSFSRQSWWDDVYFYTKRALEKDWFYCREIYPVTFHIDGNIELLESPGDRYWEDSYLAPNKKWIEKRLAERKSSIYRTAEEYEKEVEDFYKWKEIQESKGLNISYITSLET